jgi:hypothetical protein
MTANILQVFDFINNFPDVLDIIGLELHLERIQETFIFQREVEHLEQGTYQPCMG